MTLLARLRAALAADGDPARAAKMQAYLKSAMPLHGVTAARLRAACRELFAGLDFVDAAAWAREVRALWDGARFREERHAAVALTGHRRARAFQTPAALPLYEALIVDGAWWDLVDELAVHRVGAILRAYPAEVAPILRAWSRGEDLWKRRTAIIAQNRARAATDLGLLFDCLEPSLASTEFFLRKAIGWALRELARTRPDEVRAYVAANERRLSGLSRREALKHL